MLQNYFKIGLRNLVRHKLFTFINIVGLALGLAAFLLINEFVSFEKSYDSNYTQSDQMYRMSTLDIVNGVVETKDAMMTYPAAGALMNEVPEVLNATVTLKIEELVFKRGESVIYEMNVVSADSNFLDMFTYEVIAGSRETMLNEPHTMVLTETKAKEYFGTANPIGQIIEVPGEFDTPFKVTGVIQDIPQNTHYKFDILISDKSLVDRFDYNIWDSYNYYTYLILKENTDLLALQEKLDKIFLAHVGGENSERWKVDPVQSIHLTSDYTYEPELPGSAKAVTFMLIIGILILVIAWVNYINLSTAKALDRAREVGLRKVVGALKQQLIFQFLTEAFIINLIAAVLAVGIAETALPYFNRIVGNDVLSHTWSNPSFLLNLLIFFLVGTLVSGFYPALVLSSFEPVKVLKGRYHNSKKGNAMRKGLVIIQFAASLVLIAGTFTVYQQLSYMLGKDMGINTDYVVTFRMPAQSEDARKEQINSWNAFKEELRGHSAIMTVGGTSNVPGGNGSDINSTTGDVRITNMTEYKGGTIYIQYNDDEFLDAVDMKLLAGRDFDRNRKADTTVLMVNQAFLKKYGIYDVGSVVGQNLHFKHDEPDDQHQIIGVVKDFNRTSLKQRVEPTLYFPWMNPGSTIVKLAPENFNQGLAHIDATWSRFFPNTPLDYIFLDDRFAVLYAQDKRFGQIFSLFAVLAIFIASLGLFGLSAFIAMQRTKEVGVRKVLGASISGIIVMFYKDFAQLIAIAAIIGIPSVYFAMNSWLQNYAFRIEFPWIVTIMALGIVSVFALLVVGFQTHKVAVLDPAKTLKYE